MLTSRSFAEVAHHIRLDIGGKYFAFRDALCNPHAEIPGARADIGDKRSALQMQGVQNLLRLLPGIAFRIIELLGPFLRIFESMMEGAIGWAVHLMARPRVLRGHFGPRLGRRVPSRSPTPHHRKNGHRREYFGFHFVAPPGSEDAVPLLASIRVQHDLAPLRSNNSGDRAAASRRSQDDNLRADWRAVVKIDNVIIGQTDAAG